MSKLWGRACNSPTGILCAKLVGVHKELIQDLMVTYILTKFGADQLIPVDT